MGHRAAARHKFAQHQAEINLYSQRIIADRRAEIGEASSASYEAAIKEACKSIASRSDGMARAHLSAHAGKNAYRGAPVSLYPHQPYISSPSPLQQRACAQHAAEEAAGSIGRVNEALSAAASHQHQAKCHAHPPLMAASKLAAAAPHAASRRPTPPLGNIIIKQHRTRESWSASSSRRRSAEVPRAAAPYVLCPHIEASGGARNACLLQRDIVAFAKSSSLPRNIVA